MVDTWATVGSCAQIGKNVHLSGGVGIGGVLEPLQANPTIIEDNCFIGARSEVVEGVVVGEGAVLAMGVFISRLDQDHRPRDRQNPFRPCAALFGGRARRVCPASPLPDGTPGPSPPCAVIVKTVDAQTRAKTGDQRASARLMDSNRFRFLFRESDGAISAPVWRGWTVVAHRRLRLAGANRLGHAQPLDRARPRRSRACSTCKDVIAFVYLLFFTLCLLLIADQLSIIFRPSAFAPAA